MSRNCERTREACPAERCAPPPKIPPILLKPPGPNGDQPSRPAPKMPSGIATASSPRSPVKAATASAIDAAHDLDPAREHDRIGRTKHLQQQVEKDNGDDAGNQGWHGSNIATPAPKSMAPGPWQPKS